MPVAAKTQEILFFLCLVPALGLPLLIWWLWVKPKAQLTGNRKILYLALLCAFGWPVLVFLDFLVFLFPALTH